jgi:hypothetical protein
MSKITLRLVKDLSTGFKSLLIESNKLNQKKGIGTAFLLSLLLFIVLSSVAQFDLFRVNANANTITAGNIANVTDKNTASLINANTITAGNIANVTDKNTASLINANTITAGNFANVTKKTS